MGTEILPSQDCLRGSRFQREPLTLTPPLRSRRSPNFCNPSPIPNADNSYPRRRKRSPVTQRRDRSRSEDIAAISKYPAKSLVMGEVKILKRGEVKILKRGEVKILKRGEVLSSPPPQKERAVSVGKPKSKGDEDLELTLGSTDRLGPDPEIVKKQIGVLDFKVVDGVYAGSGTFYSSPPPSSLPLPVFLAKNGAATNDLRRLLGLDLE